MPGKSAPFIERMSPVVPVSSQLLLTACMSHRFDPVV
jgi:hypothetical protein